MLLLFIKMEHENKAERHPGRAQAARVRALDHAVRPERPAPAEPLSRNAAEARARTQRPADRRDLRRRADQPARKPRHLEQLIKSLDSIDWFSATSDGLGDLYEGLLEKNASETKSGAGQYFTPRPLIDSMVALMKPQPGEMIQDPAAGTGGFLIAADRYIKAPHRPALRPEREAARASSATRPSSAWSWCTGTHRLALMNCLLHGIEGDAEGVVHLGDTLGSAGSALPKADVILTNPPFGTKKGGGGPTRDDLTYPTSNKQLAFLQHIVRALKAGGRAAVVLPDNVLFEDGVGARDPRAT